VSYGTQGVARPRGRRVGATAYPAQYSYGNGAGVTNNYDWITASSQYALHLRGEDGTGADPTDSGYYLHPVTVVGDATCTTGEFKFGTGSITFDATDDRLEIAADSVFESTASDNTTWEGWFRPANLTSSETLISGYDPPATLENFRIYRSGSTLQVRLEVGGVTEISIGGGTVSAATWHHFRLVNRTGTYELYLDGVSLGTDTTTASVLSYWRWQVGANNNASRFEGELDEILIIDGAAPSAAVAGAGVPLEAPPAATSFIYSDTSNMGGWYEFEEGTSTVAGDSVGSNDGTLTNGATWETGKVGTYSAGFDGTNDYVDIPTAAIPNTAAGTISLWAKADTARDNLCWLFSYGNNSSATLDMIEIGFDQRTVTTGQDLVVQCYDGGVANTWLIQVPDSVFNARTDGLNWNHICLVQDGTSPVLYLNGAPVGSLISSDATAWIPDLALADAITVGAVRRNGSLLNTGISKTFDGVVDDVRFYNVALTASQAHALYAETPEFYVYRDCTTGASVAQFTTANKPAHDYAWVYDGSEYKKAYSGGASAGPATSPVPDTVLEATDPGSCGALDISAFNDSFDDSSLDSSRFTETTQFNGALAETTSLLFSGHSNSNTSLARIQSEAPIAGDFTAFYNFSNLTGFTASGGNSGAFYAIYFRITISGTEYLVGVGDLKTAFPALTTNQGIWYSTGGSDTNHTTSIPSNGKLTFTRTGSTLVAKIDTTQIFSVTATTSDTSNFWLDLQTRTLSSGDVSSFTATDYDVS
jgi:hypothetical protein